MPASYPVSIKSFLTYQDQPGNSNNPLAANDPTNPIPGTPYDLTIDRARVTNEIHDEVISMEQTVGITGRPFNSIPGSITLADEVDVLYNGKAWGHVDPSNNAIYPKPPPTHNHLHNQLSGNDQDVHPQYMRVDGSRGFSAPVSGQDAQVGNQLVTLEQVQNAGWLNSSQVNFIIWTEVKEEAPYAMICGTSGGIDRSQRYRMTGGYTAGYTDSNGLIRIDYSAANFRGILTLVYMKMPYPGRSAYGYTYRYEEDQLLPAWPDNQGCWIQFAEDTVVDRQAWVSVSWMVVGV